METNKIWDQLDEITFDTGIDFAIKPLLDVVLILVVFFILILNYPTHNVILPIIEGEAITEPSLNEKKIIRIELTSKGDILVNGDIKKLDDLVFYSGPQYYWLIAGDKKAPLGLTLNIFMIQKRTGGEVQLMTNTKRSEKNET